MIDNATNVKYNKHAPEKRRQVHICDLHNTLKKKGVIGVPLTSVLMFGLYKCDVTTVIYHTFVYLSIFFIKEDKFWKIGLPV